MKELQTDDLTQGKQRWYHRYAVMREPIDILPYNMPSSVYRFFVLRSSAQHCATTMNSTARTQASIHDRNNKPRINYYFRRLP